MSERLDIYKCASCGMVVEALDRCDCGASCCGEPMTLVVANTVDAAKEKHVPVIEKVADGFRVKIGSVAHPMEETHWIEWIQVIADGKAYRQFLNPGEAPEATFKLQADKVVAREYCNLHGLWKAE